MSPFFSPDGRWVALLRRQKDEKISVDGGAAVPLIDVAPFGGAAWPDDRTLLVGSGVKQGLPRTSADGGASSQILAPSGNEMFFTMPSMLPGGTDALISVSLRTAQFGHGVHRRLIAG